MRKVLVMLFFVFAFSSFLGNKSSASVIELPERHSGKDRFEVAVNVSKKGWENGARTVFISNYLAFADALAAAPLAYKNDAPILLTHPNKLTETTKQELQRLNPNKIIITGGTGSISVSVENELKKVAPVERINGKDRFEVAFNISKKMGPTKTSIIANYLAFADALAIAPYAAKNGIPILLTHKDKLSNKTLEGISGKSNTIVVGGEGSVSANVFRQLPGKVRIGGQNRYEVAANIIKQLNLSTDKVYIATGLSFADALTGSVLAAKENAPLLLTTPKALPASTKNIIDEKNIWNITLLGGTGSIAEKVIYSPTQWQIQNPAGSLMQGYASTDSLKPGDTLTFYINSNKKYNIEVFRMGYAEGSGAIRMLGIRDLPAHNQNNAIEPNTLNARWNPSRSIKIPKNWPSGFYLAKLTNIDGKQSYIPFTIRDETPNADFAVLISTNTYHAYNNWGGKSLYGYNSSNKEAAVKLSYNRPYNEGNGSGQFFSYEYNLVRWLEKKGYDITYITDVDIDNNILENSSINTLIIAGHSEYWTKQMRDSIEKHVNNGMNIGLFSANVGYWQIRLEDQKRTMVGYKEKADQDPYQQIDPSQVTDKFRSPIINRPENLLFGIMYKGIPEKTMPLVVTNPNHWIYKGTGLKQGDKIPGVVGGEIDRYDDDIEGVEVIASSPVMLYGNSSHADVVWYHKKNSGKVFATGTFYWSWFLDPYGHEKLASYNRNIERMTENVMERLNVR